MIRFAFGFVGGMGGTGLFITPSGGILKWMPW